MYGRWTRGIRKPSIIKNSYLILLYRISKASWYRKFLDARQMKKPIYDISILEHFEILEIFYIWTIMKYRDFLKIKWNFIRNFIEYWEFPNIEYQEFPNIRYPDFLLGFFHRDFCKGREEVRWSGTHLEWNFSIINYNHSGKILQN